jgi:hypothetical protein
MNKPVGLLSNDWISIFRLLMTDVALCSWRNSSPKILLVPSVILNAKAAFARCNSLHDGFANLHFAH